MRSKCYDNVMTNIESNIWHWYHNVSECHYHIQLTIKYRLALFNPEVEKIILATLSGVKDRYAIQIDNVGFDKNHVHFLIQFLPKYSGGDVIRLLKNVTGRAVFKQYPQIKKDLWGGEFWTDGYYIATVSGRGSRKVIENYIKKQGRSEDVKQLKLFAP